MTPERRLAIEIFAAAGIVIVFLLFLSIPFINPILGPLLVVLLSLVFFGLLKRRRPELFEAMRAPRPDGIDPDLPVEPSPHQDTHRAYLMLIGLSNSNQYRVTVNQSPFSIGKSKTCDFVVDDKYVSNRHLVIEYNNEDKSRFITDLSRNGTFLNGNRLQKGLKVTLSHGDTLQIGGLIFSVEYVHF